MESAEKAMPIHDRHHHIEQDQARLVDLGAQYLQSFAAVLRAKHSITFVAKDLHEQITEVVHVFHDQNRLHAYLASSFSRSSTPSVKSRSAPARSSPSPPPSR